MAKRRRRNSSKQHKVKSIKSLPKAAQVVAFTDEEEAFFREGAAQCAAHAAASDAAESFDDLEPARAERPSFWRRLFAGSAITA